jgi:hypothetical protein
LKGCERTFSSPRISNKEKQLDAPVTIFAFTLLVLGTTCSLGGDAVFTSDGQRILAIADSDDKPALEEIDLGQKTIRKITFKEFSASDSIRGVTCAQRVFVTTDSEESPLFTFADPQGWIPVRMRRHPYPSSLVFTASGEMFFAAYGDLWHGEIEKENFDNETYYSVTAYRCALLATLEIENLTPSQIGVQEIGVARNEIYVELARMGGSGDGWFARLARPVPKRTDDGSLDVIYDPAERLPVYQKALASLKILGDDFRAGKIAVSPDERRVHYVMHGKHWLVTDGKTEELHLTQK